jgi:acetaldehyde dehydrogenase (acetylating)
MPLDYRVTLDCGHTFTYRTTVSPLDRDRLICDACGSGHHAAARVVLREPNRCEFIDLTPAAAKASPAA